MSKTNIENFNVTLNFFDSEYGVPEKKEVVYDPYTPIVLRKGIVSWTTKENLTRQLRSLAIGDKVFLQPIDREGEMDFVKSPMSFVVHEKNIMLDTGTQSLLLISEDVLFKHQMHDGGIVFQFEETSLYKHLNSKFKSTLPLDIQDLLVGDIRLPTAEMVFGKNDDWCNEHLVMGSHEQLPLMKQFMYRVAVDERDELTWWWLSNKVKKELSVAPFAVVYADGTADYANTSGVYGVRPAFWIRCRP